MIVLTIVGFALFLFGCYFCGAGGTFFFIQTIPAMEKNSHAHRYPVRISLLFPIMVPICCIVPRGYERYYWACCLAQTRAWVTICTWLIGLIILTFCGHFWMWIVAVVLFALKWKVATHEMTIVIRSCVEYPFVPLTYMIDWRTKHSIPFLSVQNRLIALAFVLVSVADYFLYSPHWLGYFYWSVAFLVIIAWIFFLCLMKHALAPGHFRRFDMWADLPLAIINVVSVLVCIAFAIFCTAYDKRLWLLVALPVYCIIHYNKTMGLLLSKVIR